MRKSEVIFLSSLLAIILPTINALEWEWTSDSASCDGNPFRSVFLSVTCARGQFTRRDPSQCATGDKAYANGFLEATKVFSDGQVIVTPRISGVDLIWDKRTYGHLSDWLQPSSDQKFGEAGTYDIHYAISLPSEEDSWPGESWIVNNLITGHITVINDGECEEEEEWVPLYNYAIAGLLSCSAIARVLVKKKRKRNIVEDSVSEIDDTSNASSYYEMSGRISSRQDVVV